MYSQNICYTRSIFSPLHQILYNSNAKNIELQSLHITDYDHSMWFSFLQFYIFDIKYLSIPDQYPDH